MAWNNNGGGGGQNPWGTGGGGNRGPRGGGGNQPNVEDMIKKSQDKMKGMLPQGKGLFSLIGLGIVVLWLASGIYRVETSEAGVVLRFGKIVETTGPGLHWHMPYPVETVEVRNVTKQTEVSIGTITQTRRGRTTQTPSKFESLMLTGDENIVDVKFNVTWRIKDLQNYLFKLSDPDNTVKVVAESVMRELVGKSEIMPIITTDRDRLEREALAGIQSTLNDYEAGIEIVRVLINQNEAPAEVKEAFEDVQKAEADMARLKNEAEAYANAVIPEARGEAEKVVQLAEAYRAEVVARAEGEAARFLSVYEEYKQAKDVTKRRIYLETMEEILSGMDKTILDAKGGAVPYLSIDELKKRKGAGQ